MSDPPGPQSAVLRLFFTDEGQVSEGKQVVQGLSSIFSSRKVSPCLPPSNSASLHSCHLFVCLLPSPSVSVSLVPSPQSLSLPSSPVPSRPEGAGLSWGPLAVGDCQRALTLTSSPQAPSENPGRGHHCSSWGHRGRRVRLRMGDGVQRRMENHRRGSE